MSFNYGDTEGRGRADAGPLYESVIAQDDLTGSRGLRLGEVSPWEALLGPPGPHPAPEPGSPSSDSSCESAKRPEEKAQKEASVSVVPPCGSGSLDVPSLRPMGTWKELLEHRDHYPDSSGKGTCGVRGQRLKGVGQRSGWHLPAGN